MQATLRKGLVALLLVSGLFSAVRYWRSTLGLDRGSEALAAWETRISRAKEALPIKRGVIGYVGEWDVPGISYAFWDQESEYLLAQYTLAPFILKKGAAAEWNVAVLNPKALAVWQALHEGEFEMIDVGHSVYVLHRLGAP
ncbi:MAG: hypothetical protein ACM3QS_11485 [Bacteroidota bacterium]